MDQTIATDVYKSSITPPRPLNEIVIQTFDNLNLHGWHVPATAAVIGNIIIVHGFKDYSERYIDFAEKLASKGYEVFGFDLRGHAKSEGERVYFESIDLVLQDLKSAVKRFKEIQNNKPWIILGHSAGGALTSRYVLDNPKDVNGFILSAPFLARGKNINFFTESALKIASVVAPHAKLVDLPNKDFSRDPEVLESLVHDPFIENIKIPARTAAVMIENVDYVQANKRKNKLPFLILHGQADKINNIEGSKEFFAGIPTSPLQGKIVYPYFAHDLLHEPEHEKVENDIMKWLRQFSNANLHH